MGSAKPTKVSIVRAVYLCLLLVFRPHKFIAAEVRDNEKRQKLPDDAFQENRVLVVRRALLVSLFFVLSAGLVGFLLGIILNCLVGMPSSVTTKSLQIVAGLLLLWATFFVRGWEIQSYGGVTFSERVNQWIYRFLYFIGTAIIVLSLIWAR
ncbi:MAG: hypothetical protein JSV32_04215 [Dehalococcoidia bacterium]|nr:MAG: hypothetical protein JSV32_04215 [Dehalococcoidia bacterium]